MTPSRRAPCFINSLGAELRHMWLAPPGGGTFTTNDIIAIGETNWTTPTWGNHGVGWEGPDNDTGEVVDACLQLDTDPPNHNAELARGMVWTTYVGYLTGPANPPDHDRFVTLAIK